MHSHAYFFQPNLAFDRRLRLVMAQVYLLRQLTAGSRAWVQDLESED